MNPDQRQLEVTASILFRLLRRTINRGRSASDPDVVQAMQTLDDLLCRIVDPGPDLDPLLAGLFRADRILQQAPAPAPARHYARARDQVRAEERGRAPAPLCETVRVLKAADRLLPLAEPCGICLNPFSKLDACILNCQHQCCVGCFEDWRKAKSLTDDRTVTCPFCRERVVSVEKFRKRATPRRRNAAAPELAAPSV